MLKDRISIHQSHYHTNPQRSIRHDEKKEKKGLSWLEGLFTSSSISSSSSHSPSSWSESTKSSTSSPAAIFACLSAALAARNSSMIEKWYHLSMKNQSSGGENKQEKWIHGEGGEEVARCGSQSGLVTMLLLHFHCFGCEPLFLLVFSRFLTIHFLLLLYLHFWSEVWREGAYKWSFWPGHWQDGLWTVR